MSKKPLRCLVLLSGGLDSTLAALILKKNGVEVVGVNFSNGFCIFQSKHKRSLNTFEGMPFSLDKIAKQIGIEIKYYDVHKDFIDVVLNPPHGYGANVNPCIDCRILMLRKAKELLNELNADFVATGEVLGQRPMSQRRDTLEIIERESGLKGKLLRPLSAKRLKPTEMELKGLIDRDKLYDISGRGRKRQIQLALEFHLNDYLAPSSGCCFLTEPRYADKFMDKIKHTEKKLEIEDFELLMVGRHFRISPNLKLIVGRNLEENLYLEKFFKFVKLEPKNVKGPIAITDEGFPSDEEEILLSRIVARYSDGKNDKEVEIEIMDIYSKIKTLKVEPIKDEAILERYRI